MNNYSDYFAKHRKPPKWLIGDRVFGRYNKIPFIGTVLNDNIVDDAIGPRVSVQLDLPLQDKDTIYKIIWVGQRDLKRLTKFD